MPKRVIKSVSVSGCVYDLNVFGRVHAKLTSLVDADFRDAQLFGCGVQTLNDDVLVCLTGCLALDGDRLTDSHSDILLSTPPVRVRGDC